MQFSSRFADALAYAATVHQLQLRKGTEIPYVSHLLAVAGTVIEAGGNEDEAIAALLHDAAEDQGGEPRLQDIRQRFGDRVAQIVRDCSDALTEDPSKKPGWRERKERYIAHLEASRDLSVCLVSAADKLHNARAILRDYRQVGDELWSRFNPAAGKDGCLWYYGKLVGAYERRCTESASLASIVDDLKRTVEMLRTEIESRPVVAGQPSSFSAAS